MMIKYFAGATPEPESDIVFSQDGLQTDDAAQNPRAKPEQTGRDPWPHVPWTSESQDPQNQKETDSASQHFF
jgi:hypothetical protein